MSASIKQHFSALEDPRVDRNKLHEPMAIIILVVCAVSSGAIGWEAIDEFGKETLDWLRKFAPFDRSRLERGRGGYFELLSRLRTSIILYGPPLVLKFPRFFT